MHPCGLFLNYAFVTLYNCFVKVKVTRDLGNAIVSWHMPDPVDEDRVASVQELLEQNRDMIRYLYFK